MGGALDDGPLPFPEPMFWERYQICNFFDKLRFAAVRGFTGQEQEVNFVKHLITKANMVEKLYVICDSSIMEEATYLLSLRRASVYLSIILKSERRNHTMIDEFQRVLRPTLVSSFFSSNWVSSTRGSRDYSPNMSRITMRDKTLNST